MLVMLLQAIMDGLASAAVYASLALAITLIHRATGVANFAQGEMAMLCTYVAWQLTSWGLPLWVTAAATLAIAFAFGALIEMVFIRPVAKADLLTVVIITFGLFLVFNNAAGLIWGHVTKTLSSPFPSAQVEFNGVVASWQTLGTAAVLVVEVVLLWLLFQRTKIGLAMRAAASNRTSAELCAIPSGQVFMLSWGLAAVLGALAGILIAPRVFVEPHMMGGVLIYAFAAAALGGINSPVGAVVGSLIVGLTESIAITFIPGVGADLKIVIPFLIISGTLLLKPSGLFATKASTRV
jgi:branched-chain amino acid transport system permease protein